MKDGVTSNKNRYLRYFKSHAASFGLIFLVLFGATYCDSVTPGLYRQLTSSFQSGKLEPLIETAVQLFLYTIASSALFLIGSYRTNISGEAISSNLRLDLFLALQKMPFWFFTMSKSGHFISLFNHQLLGAHNGITKTVPRIVTNILTIILAAYQLLRTDWKVLGAVCVALPIFILVTERLQSRLSTSHKKAHDLRSQMNDSLKSSLSAPAILAQKNFALSDNARQTFASSSSQIQTSQEDITFFQDVHTKVIFLIFAIFSVGAFVFTALFQTSLSSGGDVGNVVQLVASFQKLQMPIMSLGTIRIELSNSITCFESIFCLLDESEKLQEQQKKRFSGKKLALSAWPGDVVLDDVSFSYPNYDQFLSNDLRTSGLDSMENQEEEHKMVLNGISLTIKAGSKVAIMGPNGSGKTTLAFILAGLHLPTGGKIRTAGHEYDSLDEVAFRNLVGILDQDPWFEHGTILSNLLLAYNSSALHLRNDSPQMPQDPDALQAIERACKIANIYDFIDTLPEKFNTQIGENAMRLSSGQRQKLALARLVLKSPSFVILDEFNSHLDIRTENEILHVLLEHFKDATIVIITHRFSIPRRVDEVIYLSGGSILEHGPHDTLITQNGPYAQLYMEYKESL